MNALERVQNTALNGFLPFLTYISYPEQLAVIDLEPLELGKLKADLVLYDKCLHSLSALPNDAYFLTQFHVSNIRSGGNRLQNAK